MHKWVQSHVFNWLDFWDKGFFLLQFCEYTRGGHSNTYHTIYKYSIYQCLRRFITYIHWLSGSRLTESVGNILSKRLLCCHTSLTIESQNVMGDATVETSFRTMLSVTSVLPGPFMGGKAWYNSYVIRWTWSWCNVDSVSVIMATSPRTRTTTDSKQHKTTWLLFQFIAMTQKTAHEIPAEQ